jgi:hypothetical protein
MRVKFTKFVREDVGIGNKVKEGLSMLILHFNHILTKVVLPGDFITLWEMIDFLIFVQAFV